MPGTNTNRLTTRIVPPHGPIGATICFIGEAPGEVEDRCGLPFQGPAGQFHDRCLSQVGIVRSETLHTNLFNQRPPKNNAGYFFQDSKCTKLTWEGEEHVEALRMWLESLRTNGSPPNILVSLGRHAMRFLTGKSRINKWRGSVVPCTLSPGYKVYIMYHPSYVNRLINEKEERYLGGEKKKDSQNALPLYLLDLQRVLQQSETPELLYPNRTFYTELSYSELCSRLTTLTKATGSVAVDIETLPSATGPIVWKIGFAESPGEGFSIHILRNQRFNYPLHEEAHLWKLISEVFLNPNLKKIFQGGIQYDLPILGRYYGLRLADRTLEDTMWVHQATYPYLRKSLQLLASIYTWEPYYKDESKVHLGNRRSDEAEAAYNAKDCCVTREVLPVITREAKEHHTWLGYLRQMHVSPSIIAMITKGVRVDKKKLDELNQEYTQLSTDAKRAIEAEIGKEINLNSSSQKARLLYGYLGLPIITHPKTKKPTTDASAIARLTRQFPNNSILKKLAEYQEYTKLIQDFTNITIGSDGRVHTSYGWVSTWRLNSSEGPFGDGRNLQNIPRRVRSFFIPDEGLEMGARDLIQAEAQFVDWDSENLGAIEDFKNGTDTHWKKACELFNIPLGSKYLPEVDYRDPISKQLLKMKDLRKCGKIIRHAGNYDMGPIILQNIFLVNGFYYSAAQCKKIMEISRANSPHLLAWHRRIREQLNTTRTLITPEPFARKREFLGRLNDTLYKAGYAFRPQSTIGEILQVGTQRIFDRLDYLDILLNVHDEIVWQCHPNDMAKAHADVEELLETPIEFPIGKLIIGSDGKRGPSWGEMKEIK